MPYGGDSSATVTCDPVGACCPHVSQNLVMLTFSADGPLVLAVELDVWPAGFGAALELPEDEPDVLNTGLSEAEGCSPVWVSIADEFPGRSIE